MEVSIDLIVFEKLSKYSASEILNDVFEDDDLSDSLFITSGYELEGGWSDSYQVYGSFTDACSSLAQVTDVDKSLKKSYFRIFLANSMYDDLSLRDFPEEGYISSISSNHCKKINAALNKTRGDALIKKARGFFNNPEEVDLEAYLNQWNNAFSKAAENNLGILIHMG